MEVKKAELNKKKKNSFKRTCKRTIRKIVKFFINLKDKFMALPDRTRYIVYIWAIVLVILLVLIGGSNASAKKVDKYHTMEETLKNATLTYVSTNQIFPNVGKKLKVDLDMLRDFKYIDKEEVDETCKGYSIVYYDEETGKYTINPYLNCKHYTTKDFALDYEQ